MLKLSFVLLIMFLLVSNTLADTVMLKDSTVFVGLIIQADDTHVWVKSGNELRKLDKENIQTYVFSRADIIHQIDNQHTMCKVITEENGKIIYFTEDGTGSISKNEIKFIAYNTGTELKTSSLPPLGQKFKNKPNDFLHSYHFRKHIYLKGGFGFHSPASANRHYIGDDETRINSVSLDGRRLGIELGYAFIPSLNLGVGFENFTSKEVSYNYSLASNSYSYQFYSINARYNYSRMHISNLRGYFGLSFGLINGTENLKSESTGTKTASSKKPAAGIKLGLTFQKSKFEFFGEMTYLASSPQQFKYAGNKIDDRDFDFSGMGINLGLSLLFFGE